MLMCTSPFFHLWNLKVLLIVCISFIIVFVLSFHRFMGTYIAFYENYKLPFIYLLLIRIICNEDGHIIYWSNWTLLRVKGAQFNNRYKLGAYQAVWSPSDITWTLTQYPQYMWTTFIPILYFILFSYNANVLKIILLFIVKNNIVNYKCLKNILGWSNWHSSRRLDRESIESSWDPRAQWEKLGF